MLTVELRQQPLLARIARRVGVSEATVSRVLDRAEISKLGDLEPRQPAQHYAHTAQVDPLHIATNKLDRLAQLGHRITGSRRMRALAIGWDLLLFGATSSPA